MKFKPAHTSGKIIVELGRNNSLPETNGAGAANRAFGIWAVPWAIFFMLYMIFNLLGK